MNGRVRAGRPSRARGGASRLRRAVSAAASLLLVGALTAACAVADGAESGKPGVLTIGMTASDIPNLDTSLSADQGYEGTRFVGMQLYDGLTRYDLAQGDHVPDAVPSLATSWEQDPGGLSWTFHLRQGVSFTDGTPFDAYAVVFNLDRYLNKESPQYYPQAGAQASLSLTGVQSYAKVDDRTVRIFTKGEWSHLPGDLTTVFMASPAAVRMWGNTGFAEHPVGTGPFVFRSAKRGQELVLDANRHYWRGAAKIDRLVLRPMPDELSRVAALRAGEVNWIEAPSPDNVPPLRDAGYQIMTNGYDHIWPWLFDTSHGPLSDRRVRQALNYAIDREQMSTDLLGGTAEPATQLSARSGIAYDPANDVFGHDPSRARQLLAEAGYPEGFSMTVSYPTGGSGNMQPGPMNEELRSDLAKVGVRVELKPIEWAAMLTSYVSGSFPDGADAVNISLTFIQEVSWSTAFASGSPLNLTRYSNPEVDRLLGDSLKEPDLARRSAIYAQIVGLIDRDAPWLVVVNDRNPRALAANVHGFVEPQSWFVDLTTVSVS